ncbi:pseudouridine synthase [Dechloromonas sp. XY25]|uniref:Pseudouridine synthase n=1 Tax=Dechloromonas hankyongensis TaxID=2908002 RepID=A0ABS9K055_9RHOO|nr:pseudouridine synthase [Dechloromonas hankyongensis]MCG2576552.1 pseudouridine synthase [Dechloromonas hankyongensis]
MSVADDPWAKWRKPDAPAEAPAAAKPAAEPQPAATEKPVNCPAPVDADVPVKADGTLRINKAAIDREAGDKPARKPLRGGPPRVRQTLQEKQEAEAKAKAVRAPRSEKARDDARSKPPGKPHRGARTASRDGAKASGRSPERTNENPWGKAAERKPAAARPMSRPAAEDPWKSHRAAAVDAPKVAEQPKGPPPAGVRLSKVMSERGLCSRREADLWIERGWVFVNGEPVSELGSRIDPSAEISISKEAQKDQAKQVTILLHKPVGYVSGQPEPGCIPAVTLITPEAQVVQSGDPEFKPWMLRGLAPAGRLDIDSTGLLVLTSDGRVAKRLIGEDSEAEKEYLVRVSGEMIEGGLDLLRHGLELDGKPLKQAWVKQLNEDQLHFILKEGKKRQIRRMCELVGLKVIGLKRVRIGRIRLGDLPLGQWRFLRADEAF